jgi:hypothetical protein
LTEDNKGNPIKIRPHIVFTDGTTTTTTQS